MACGLALWAVLNVAGRIGVDEPTRVQQMHAAYVAIAWKDAVSIGGSVATAVDFDAMCLSGTDFFNNGQDLLEVEAIVDHILADPAPPQVFMLVMVPGAQIVDNGRPPMDGSWARKSTYRFLQERGDWGLISGDWRQAFAAQAMPATGRSLSDPYYGLLLRILGRLPPPDPAREADTLAMKPRGANASATAMMTAQALDAKGIAYHDPDRAARGSAALLRTSAKLSAQGRQLVIVVPPVTEALAREMIAQNGEIVTEFYRLLSRIDSPDTLVIDSWRDLRYARNFSYFRDHNHLNAPGARIFSRDLEKILQRRGIARAGNCR